MVLSEDEVIVVTGPSTEGLKVYFTVCLRMHNDSLRQSTALADTNAVVLSELVVLSCLL